jgi:hypothetical protein
MAEQARHDGGTSKRGGNIDRIPGAPSTHHHRSHCVVDLLQCSAKESRSIRYSDEQSVSIAPLTECMFEGRVTRRGAGSQGNDARRMATVQRRVTSSWSLVAVVEIQRSFSIWVAVSKGK